MNVNEISFEIDFMSVIFPEVIQVVMLLLKDQYYLHECSGNNFLHVIFMK